MDIEAPKITNTVGENFPNFVGEGYSSKWCSNDGLWWGAQNTSTEIPPGVYRTILHDRLGPALTELKIDTDELIILPDSVANELIEEFKRFWTLKSIFKEYGFLHKRGIILHGPPGSGKTCTVQLMIRHIVKEIGGIALFIEHPQVASYCFQLVRRIEPNRPIVVVMEDLDALVAKYHEPEYLAMLDGEAQVDNIFFVATTNYLDDLDGRFRNRPSRFDYVKRILYPSKEDRAAFLRAKVKQLSEEEVLDIANCTDEFSLAHLREIVVSTKLLGYSLRDTVERLRKMSQEATEATNYKPESRSLGFQIRK